MSMDKWRELFAEHVEDMDDTGALVLRLDPPIEGLQRRVVYMDDEMQMCRLMDEGSTILKRMFVY